MNLLLDTHLLIWALNEDPRLPGKAREMILDESNTIYYSSVSIWEVAVKHASHPDNVELREKNWHSSARKRDFCPWRCGIGMFLLWRRSQGQKMHRRIMIRFIGCWSHRRKPITCPS